MKRRDPIYIGAVKMTPLSTRRDPWSFARLTDVREFALIASRPVWAVIAGDLRIYHVYPGGRCECYPPEVRDKWAAEVRA